DQNGLWPTRQNLSSRGPRCVRSEGSQPPNQAQLQRDTRAPRGSFPRNLNRSLSRADVLESVVSPYRDRVLTGCQSLHGELVTFRSAVADAMCRRQQNPLAAVHAVLCLLNAAGRIG